MNSRRGEIHNNLRDTSIRTRIKKNRKLYNFKSPFAIQLPLEQGLEHIYVERVWNIVEFKDTSNRTRIKNFPTLWYHKDKMYQYS